MTRNGHSMALVMTGLFTLCAFQLTSVAQVPPAKPPLPRTTYGELPLSFEANQGQADPNVRFMSRGRGYSVFLTDREAVLALGSSPRSQHQAGIASDVIRLQLANANAAPRVAGQDVLPGTANYLLGRDRAKWRIGVPTYGRVRYAEVYPGVDLLYHGKQQELEYDFVVAPGADLRPIQLHFAGAARAHLDAHGDLEVAGRHGHIVFHAPVLYQESQGRREPVRGRFALLRGNTVGFAVGPYDRSRPLVIDPVLSYSTYLGGSNYDAGAAIAADAQGNAYVTGLTYSADFPVTAGAYGVVGPEGEFGGPPPPTGFVTKINAAGTQLVYSTYLGGSGTSLGGDDLAGIQIDSKGDAYVVGTTLSGDIPVTPGAYQPTKLGGCDSCFTGWVAELNPTGTGLIYATYLGGSGGDTFNAIALDNSDAAYLTGYTASQDFPVSTAAFQKTNQSANMNAFVTKLNPSGTALVYSTYLGGTGYEQGLAIAVDTGGNAYVTGFTASSNFPVSPMAYQKAMKAGATSTGFVTEVNPSGTALVYSTYLGGSGNSNLTSGGGDSGNGIAVDSAGDAYVAGSTASSDFPVTANAFQTTQKAQALPGTSCFVTKLQSGGSGLIYSTYLGGTGTAPAATSVFPADGDACAAIAIDASGNAYVTGIANSSNFPITSQAFQTVNPDPIMGSAFVTQLNASGSALVYSTYLGGTGNAQAAAVGGDYGNGIALDPSGNVYVTGKTYSSNFPITPSAFQTTNNSFAANFSTVFIAKFDLAATTLNATTTTLSASATTIATGQSITFQAKVASAASGAPTGAITFTEGTSVLGTGALSATGSATYSTSALAPGPHSITAAYGGDTNFAASTSAVLTVTVTATAPTFSLSASPASLTIAPGQSATAVISVAPQNGFSAATTFNCSGLPAGVSCTFSPATVTPTAGSAATTTLTVTASATSGASVVGGSSQMSGLKQATMGIVACCFGLGWKKRRDISLLPVIAVIGIGSLAILPGCGGSSGSNPASAPAVAAPATVSVVATSGSVEKTISLTVTIQ